MRGDFSEATQVQQKIQKLRKDLYAPGYPPAMVKRILFLMDERVGNNRLPALAADTEVDAALMRVIEDFGLNVKDHVSDINKKEKGV
jgi:4-hydroxy-tetrahydrodipicolinate synthase